MKKAIKAFIAGFLSCLLLSATIVWADTSGVMREVFYGVNVVVNGRTQSFDDDMRPFISNGRVFLPARAVAEVLNIPVDWDSDTATVYIGQKPQPRVNQNHLTVAATNTPWTLDPAGANDTNLALLSRQVFDTLVELDPDAMDVLPALAASWNMPNAQTVTMALRPDIYFHNGFPLTAYDVQFSLERAADSIHAAFVLGMIDHVTVHDYHNLTIHLTEPFAPILRHLAHPMASIVSLADFEAHGWFSWDDDSQHILPIGTGPFIFADMRWHDSIDLVRNDNYWGTLPQIETLTFIAVPDPAVRLIMVEVGEADIALAISPADVAHIQASPDITVMRQPNLTIDYIGFNMTKAPWDNPLVIQAINYAIDIQDIIDIVFDGVGTPAAGPLSSRAWGFAQPPAFATNIERAKALLAEAGYPDGFDRPVELWVNEGNPHRLMVAEIVQFALAPLGIEVHIVVMEWGLYLEATTYAEHDMFILGWAASTGDADFALFSLFHSSSWGSNRTQHNDPALDILLERGRTEINPARRAEIYAQALQLLRDNPSMVPFRQGEHLVVVSNDLHGFVLDPTGIHRFSGVFFED